MHACSAGPVGRLACGEPSFTPTLNTTTPAVSLMTTVTTVATALASDGVTGVQPRRGADLGAAYPHA